MTEKKQPRLSISITEELMQKLEGCRDVINISDICRQALSNVVDTILRSKMEVAETKEETIKRLRKEAVKLTMRDYVLGVDIGYKQASIMSLNDILYFYGAIIHDHDIDDIKSRFDHIQCGIEPSAYTEYMEMTETDADAFAYLFPLDFLTFDAFLSGWLEGIKHFWNEIEDEVVFPITDDFLNRLREKQVTLKIHAEDEKENKDVKKEDGNKVNNGDKTPSSDTSSAELKPKRKKKKDNLQEVKNE